MRSGSHLERVEPVDQGPEVRRVRLLSVGRVEHGAELAGCEELSALGEVPLRLGILVGGPRPAGAGQHTQYGGQETKSVKGLDVLGTPVMHDMMVGFRFVFLQHRVVFSLMITAVLYNLAISAFVFLLPVVAKELLQVGPMELGWLWSALGIGMLAASIWLARMPQGTFQERIGKIGRSLTIGGLAVCALGLIQTPVLFSTFFLIVIIGGSTSLFYPVVWAMLQEVTPEHMLGRVFTTFSVGGMASAMVGMAGFGWAADTLGPAVSLIGIGLLLLLTAMVTMQVSRRGLVVSPAVA